MRATRSAIALGILLLSASGAWAFVPGGRAARSDCLAEWRVTDRTVTPTKGRDVVECQDGDPICDADGRADGRCTFNVSVCVLQDDPLVPACLAPATGLHLRHLTRGLEPPISLSHRGCGRPTPLRVATRLNARHRRIRSVRVALRMTAVAPGMRDANRLLLRCLPAEETCPPAGECPLSPAGVKQPNAVVLSVDPFGSDLDQGWAGRAHDVRVPFGTNLQICLENCNMLLDPTCDTRILTGKGTANGQSFGPPVPVLAGSVPVCLVQEYARSEFRGGTANLSTGAVDATIALHTKVFVTDPAKVCPQCVSGRCEGGANDGGACSPPPPSPAVTAIAPIVGPSSDCPPDDDALVGTLDVAIPLTTGVSRLESLPGASSATPCFVDGPEPAGVPADPDACTGECDVGCASGGCDVTDPPSCPAPAGGIRQACCTDDAALGCFPTRSSALTRVGRTDAPQPPWPGSNYPKTSRPVVVGTFCEGATGLQAVDATIGLPGPAAIVLPSVATWKTPTPCNGGDGPAPQY